MTPTFAAPNAAANAAARACPARTFEAFARLFADDAGVQRRHTRTPLTERRLVDAEPEPRQVTRQLSAAEIRYPLIPPKSDRDKRGLSVEIIGADSRSPRLKLYKPDTDQQTLYVFDHDACWSLVKIDDQSL